MLTENERWLKLKAADAATLARIDAILTGAEDCLTVTLTDAAARLGCSRTMIYNLVHAGRLDVVALNGVNRVLVQSIKELASGRRPADAATIARIKANTDKRRENARIAQQSKQSKKVAKGKQG